MEVNKERAQAASECLNFNKQLNTVHVTSDLNCFPHKGDAIHHARSLPDKTIDVFTRDEADKAEFDIVDSLKETIKAKTIPNADLAKEKKAGDAKNKAFDKVKKPAEKDPAEKYGTGGKPEKAKAAPKKAAAPKVVKPATEPAPEKPADQQPNSDNQE